MPKFTEWNEKFRYFIIRKFFIQSNFGTSFQQMVFELGENSISCWMSPLERKWCNTYFILRNKEICVWFSDCIPPKMSYKMKKLNFQCKRTTIFLFGVVKEGIMWTYTNLYVLNTNYKVVINFIVTYTIICFTKLLAQMSEFDASLIRSKKHFFQGVTSIFSVFFFQRVSAISSCLGSQTLSVKWLKRISNLNMMKNFQKEHYNISLRD